jgi:hypothetical protein
MVLGRKTLYTDIIEPLGIRAEERKEMSSSLIRASFHRSETQR